MWAHTSALVYSEIYCSDGYEAISHKLAQQRYKDKLERNGKEGNSLYYKLILATDYMDPVQKLYYFTSFRSTSVLS